MTEFHRKVELQSPEDLQYLVSNIRRAANEKIDKDWPPIEEEDTMRKRVEELVHDYINTVFQTTAENITINGLDPSPELLSTILSAGANSEAFEIEEHEPFNTKLFEKAKDHARQEEDLIEEIAALRRKMPGVVVEGVKREYREGVEGDEEVLRRVEERDVGGEKGHVVGIGKLLKQDEVEERRQKGVKGLEGLMRSMPEMVARKERAEKAENYVVSGNKR